MREHSQAVRNISDLEDKMRKRKISDSAVIHVMADGKVRTNKEFMKKPYVVSAEENCEFHFACNRAFDPMYYQKENLKRKFVLAEQCRAELEAQQAAIASELKLLNDK